MDESNLAKIFEENDPSENKPKNEQGIVSKIKNFVSLTLKAMFHKIKNAAPFMARFHTFFHSPKKIASTISGIFLLTFFVKSFIHIKEYEVGIFLNNLTGSMSVEERSGFHFIIPLAYTPYRLDRRIQSLVMSEQGSNSFRGGDAVKIKTSDGSNVSMDTQVTYRLISSKAAEVVKSSGLNNSFGELWIRSSVRAMGAREFGKLTTEQIYDASLRNEKAQTIVEELNKELKEKGIEIIAVVPEEFRFYKEYEEVIKKKKLADQEVEEEQAKARLALQEQKKKVADAEFAAEAKKATAEGEAERTKAEAVGHAQKIRLEADSSLVTTLKQAEGQLAMGLADAESLRQSASALSGVGGVNLVALEYTKQLEKINFVGVPFTQDGRVGQYRVVQNPASLLEPISNQKNSSTVVDGPSRTTAGGK